MTDEEKLIKSYPEVCLITGLERCDSYLIDGNVVYVTRPAYDAYTLPQYNKEDECFYRTHYDMDDDFREETEFLCELEELENHPNLANIKNYYGIELDGEANA